MEIYIIRHAIAVPRGTRGYTESKRPLTDIGKKRMEQAANGLRVIMPDIDILLTSPYKRAYDTAVIVAKKMKWLGKLKIFQLLKAGTPSSELLDGLSNFNKYKRIALVGHEPDLSLLTSILLGAKGSVIEFKKGGVARIDIDGFPPKTTGVLKWLVKPGHLRALAQ